MLHQIGQLQNTILFFITEKSLKPRMVWNLVDNGFIPPFSTLISSFCFQYDSNPDMRLTDTSRILPLDQSLRVALLRLDQSLRGWSKTLIIKSSHFRYLISWPHVPQAISTSHKLSEGQNTHSDLQNYSFSGEKYLRKNQNHSAHICYEGTF